MVLAALLALAASASASPSPAARYDFLSGGRVTGALLRTEQPGRSVKVEFAFTENGRGPKLVETVRLDAAGRVSLHEVQGTATFGARVDERFARDVKPFVDAPSIRMPSAGAKTAAVAR